MSSTQTSPFEISQILTQHAMLVVWGLYAQSIGLVAALEQVKLGQKRRTHTPQIKVLEFLVAILAGLPHLQDISRSAHPLDQDAATAEAWGRAAWADYSGVSRTLQQLSDEEVSGLIAAVERISQPFIDQEVERALATAGYLVYDADLTGRPVSSTSTSYPDTAFGYMGDTIQLGYQAALVSLHSPTFGRLWLANQLHPGDTVSCTLAQALVSAAELRTGRYPRRRTELLACRLEGAEAALVAAGERMEESYQQLQEARAQVHDTRHLLSEWRQQVALLSAAYERQRRQPTAHCALSRARRKMATYEARLPRCQKALGVAERRMARHTAQYDEAAQRVTQLRRHQEQLLADNAANPAPVQAVFRLDGGFASRQNIAWLMEMGYDIYSKGKSTTVQATLSAMVTSATKWTQVGGNARMTAWSHTTVDGHYLYPLNVALAHYQTGDSLRRAVLLHFGSEEVTADLSRWFHSYNGRQTIEAGIKEGKNVFQMHHLKVRAPQALLLQEHLACFAANFVRFAACWLAQSQPAQMPTRSVKQMVQVGAHTSAWVQRQGDMWLLTFTEQSLYAGRSLRFGDGPLQLPLPLLRDIHFCHF
jgi:hypothetical protein